MNAETLNTKTRTGGEALVEALKIHGCDACLLRAGRVLSGRARCALRRARADPPHHLPPGRRCGEHGRSLWQADGQARHLLRHARARRHQRLHRCAHGLPGFDADDPLRRAGGAVASRSRSVPGSRLQGDVRAAGEMGGRDPRGATAFPNMWRAPFTRRRPAGPAPSCCHCRKMFCPPCATRRRRALIRRPNRWPRARPCAACMR